jgi:hypothetical protein
MFTCCRSDGTCPSIDNGNPYTMYTPEHRCWAIARKHGINAANWIDIDDSNAQRILAGIEDGDPMVMDAFRTPSLSGEFADDYCEADLMSDCDVVPHDGSLLADDIADQYLSEVSEAFWHEVERRCLYQIG